MKHRALKVPQLLQRFSWLATLWGRILLVVGLLVLIGVGWLASGLLPLGGPVTTVTIPHGSGRIAISKQLESAGIIRNRWTALGYFVVSGRTVQAGTYMLNPSQPMTAVLTQLSTGKDPVIVLTIPEGWRKEQIADLLARKGLDGERFLELVSAKEGRLFPDTYYVTSLTTPEELVAKLETNFTKRTEQLAPTQEQLILASIVEREAKRDDQRALIAGVFQNRLTIGMKLDADPTVQYARDTLLIAQGRAPETYWKSITLRDYSQVTSPYNTYLHVGLPPSPIANPGLKSIEAAVHPQKTDAYFFFHRTGGDIVTSRTFAEHLEKKAKFLR